MSSEAVCPGEGIEVNSKYYQWLRSVGLAILLVAIFFLPAHADSGPFILKAPNGQSTPHATLWNGTNWVSAGNSVNVGCTMTYIVGDICPVRDEYAFLVLDYCNDINLLTCKAGTWSLMSELTSNADGSTSRMFDLVYERASGDAMMVYWEGSSNQLRYRVYDGGALAAANVVSNSANGSVRWVKLRAHPTTDEMIAVWLDNSKNIYAKVWNGSSWGHEIELTSKAHSNSHECFDVAYESSSGGALVGYCNVNSKNPHYRIWNGTSWSGEASMSSIGDKGNYLRLAPDPENDGILCVVQDKKNDLSAQFWNGSNWSSATELEDSLNRNNCRQFDVAFEKGGTDALVVYASDWSNQIRYRTWNGSSWSAEAIGPDVGDDQIVVQLRTGVDPGQVFVQMSTDAADVYALNWGGASFQSSTKIEDSISAWSHESFYAVIPGDFVQPVEVPYFTDFEDDVDPAWSTSSTDYDADFTKFLGRFSGAGKAFAELKVKTTVGESYTLGFDLYAIDSWAGDNTSHGPDGIIVEVNGTSVFAETFSQRPDQFPGSYENPWDEEGKLGFGSRNNTDDDGIYRNVTVSFVATSAVSTIAFTETLGEGINDESVGIDNVSVTTSRFINVSSARGFDVNTSSDSTYASGLHSFDADGDGDLDVILGGNQAKRMLNGGSAFAASSFGTGNERRQHAIFDVDNDGDIDFWSGNHSSYYEEACYRNDGAGSFSDIGNIGFSNPNNNEGVAAADVNRDGWCDIVHFCENDNWIGHHQGDPGASLPSLIGTNDNSYGLSDGGDIGNGDYVSSGDVNNDGYLDFFYHYSGGKLFVSNGDGTYTENVYGINVTTGNNDKFGSAWADYDNDGDLDLYCARWDSNNTGYLWRNDVSWGDTPSGSFSNQAASAAINDESGQFGCAWGDYDNDGDLDLYIATRSGPNKLYQNQGNGTFRMMDEGAGVTGNCQDVVFVDFDNDGDLDIAVTREDDTAVLLENRTNNDNYLKVRVVGAGSGATNVAAIGVRVELWSGDGKTYLGRREIGVARGLGTEPLWAHFGGVDPTATYQVRTYLHSRDNSNPLVTTVVPQSVSATIGSTTIPQMLTITEANAKKRIILWRELRNRS